MIMGEGNGRGDGSGTLGRKTLGRKTLGRRPTKQDSTA